MKDFWWWRVNQPLWFFYHRNLMPKLRGHKPFILPLLNSEWWGKRLQEMQFGQIVIGKAQFVITTTILLKVFDVPYWVYAVAIPVVTFLLWYSGYFLEKKGVRKHFREAEFKNVRLR